MKVDKTFTFSEAEARRMRRGAFLPVVLIIPMAAMFGLDSSKSQPMHFLMTFAIASGIAAVVVTMGWYGAQRRIADFSAISLSIVDGKIYWMAGQRKTELDLNDVTKINVQTSRGMVRTIDLIRENQTRTTLEGYDRMDELLDELRAQSRAEITLTSKWFGF